MILQVMVLIFLVTFIFATLAYYIEEDNSKEPKVGTPYYNYWNFENIEIT